MSQAELPFEESRALAPRDRLRQQLRDERGGRIVFVSHCILNQNTRFLSGAFRPGGVDELVDAFQRQELGICQLPCPEQRAWGGALKPYLLTMYGSRGCWQYRARRLLLPLFLAYTRWRYRRLAAAVVRDIADYRRSGVAVVGMLGVDGSPSCGVGITLDLRQSLAVVAGCPLEQLTRKTMTDDVVRACRQPGLGLFVAELQRQLHRRQLDVPLLRHDLFAELPGGQPNAALDAQLGPTLDRCHSQPG